MKKKNEKPGFFQRLTGNNKAQNPSCCCFALEEIPEETSEKKEIKKDKKNTCCS
jgi:hypothetical protein